VISDRFTLHEIINADIKQKVDLTKGYRTLEKAQR
jgi:hypothetical protein